MLGFVIPFKPKRNSKNWGLDSLFLTKTLQSILHQSDRSFHIYVIYHDLPDNPVKNTLVDYHQLPFDYLQFDQIQDREEQMTRNSYLREKDVEYIFDQGRKQMFGVELAKKEGCEYVMALDGDDVIHKNLVAYVNKNKKHNQVGWFVERGFFYVTERGVYLRQRNNMHLINGSSYIIHTSIIPSNDLSVPAIEMNNFFSNHPYLRSRIREYYEKELTAIPFYATVCFLTDLNWNTTIARFRSGPILGQFKFLARIVCNTRRIKKNFYLE